MEFWMKQARVRNRNKHALKVVETIADEKGGTQVLDELKEEFCAKFAKAPHYGLFDAALAWRWLIQTGQLESPVHGGVVVYDGIAEVLLRYNPYRGPNAECKNAES
jgi:hypothetical protein